MSVSIRTIYRDVQSLIGLGAPIDGAAGLRTVLGERPTANDADAKSHRTLAATLGALGPGGTAAITFEDYTRLFGSEPSEDEMESRRARKFAADNACDRSVDHRKKRVWFRKR